MIKVLDLGTSKIINDYGWESLADLGDLVSKVARLRLILILDNTRENDKPANVLE